MTAAMYHHLRYNHFPPVDLEWAGPAERAIEEANDGFFEAMITGPDGELHSVMKIMDGLHLWEFLDDADPEDAEWIDEEWIDD